jgi:glycosyltransferase involved in cell wall biosynthesis
MNDINIITTTYNHEKFIKTTLDSFLMQKTNLKFKIIISDDCSTDNTSNIIEEYYKKYPNLIKFIKREKNIGAINNYIHTLSNVDAKYVIICEGDDYFCDKNKLQIQYDYLEKNPDKSICFHPVKIKKEGYYFKNLFPKKFPKPKRRFYKNNLTLKDLLQNNFIQTNSAMYRWRFKDSNDFFDNFPNSIMPCDYYLHLLHAKVGNIGFIDKTMAVYRIWNGGIWFNSNANIDKHLSLHGLKQLNFYLAVAKNIATDSASYIKQNQNRIDVIKNYFLKNNRFNEIEKELKYLDFILNGN